MTDKMKDHIIYGNHDERTLAQMRRCMEIGSATAGVTARRALTGGKEDG